jgi:plastocyanin
MRGHTGQLFWVVASLALPCICVPAATAADLAVNAGPGLSFSPDTLTVNQGDSVTWTNAGGVHNVRFEDNSFAQPPFVSADPWSVTRTFGTTGTFRYFCDVHRAAGMTGTVNVSAPEPTADPAAGQPDTSVQGAPKPAGDAVQCASQRRFMIRLRGIERAGVKSARVDFNGKQITVRRELVDGVRRHTALIDMRGLPRGAYTAAITVTTTSGRVLRGTRTYRTCAGKLLPARLPDL